MLRSSNPRPAFSLVAASPTAILSKNKRSVAEQTMPLFLERASFVGGFVVHRWVVATCSSCVLAHLRLGLEWLAHSATCRTSRVEYWLRNRVVRNHGMPFFKVLPHYCTHSVEVDDKLLLFSFQVLHTATGSSARTRHSPRSDQRREKLSSRIKVHHLNTVTFTLHLLQFHSQSLNVQLHTVHNTLLSRASRPCNVGVQSLLLLANDAISFLARMPHRASRCN